MSSCKNNPIAESLENTVTADELSQLRFEKTIEPELNKKHPQAYALIKDRAPELLVQYAEETEKLKVLLQKIDDLEPLQMTPERPPETPFPVDALLGMAEAVKFISDTMQFPLAMVAQCALGLGNSLIQALVNVGLPTIGVVPTSLFLMTGADTGEGKSAADSILSNPIRGLMLSAQMEYEEKLEDYCIRKDVYESEVKKIKNPKDTKADTDMVSKESRIRSLIRPTKPMNPKLQSSDFTMEGLRHLFQTGCPRLSIMTDEGATWLEGHAMVNDRRGSGIAIFCDRWDGKPWDVDRSNEEKSCSLRGRRLAISVSTQISVLKKIMADEQANDQGLLGRCLIAMPDSCVHKRRMTDIKWNDKPSISLFFHTLARLYNTKLITVDGDPYCLDPRLLKLDTESKEIYMDYGNDRFKNMNEKYAPIRALALKADQHIGRLAANLAVWEDPTTGIIKRQHMEAACYLMNYYLEEKIRFAACARHVSSSSFMGKVCHSLDWMRKKGINLVFPGLLQRNSMKGESIRFVLKAMNVLVEHGYAIQLPVGTIVGEYIKKGVVEKKPRKMSWLIIG